MPDQILTAQEVQNYHVFWPKLEQDFVFEF
jgi:hypothetical protein